MEDKGSMWQAGGRGVLGVLATIWKIEMKFKPCNLHGKISGPQKQPHEWP